MTDDLQPETSSASAPEAAPKAKKTRAKKSAAGAEVKEPGTKTRKTTSKGAEPTTAEKTAAKKKAPAKRKPAAKPKAGETAAEWVAVPFEDPIGDTTDGEAWTFTGEEPEPATDSEAEAYRAGVAVDAVDGTLQPGKPEPEGEAEEEPGAEPAKIAEEIAEARERDAGTGASPPAKLERLQKILSQAGIASRRRAEEMIVAGRVVVNGQVVTELGSKADAEHDHIRVDGKLLHGAERHRYFVLNKPKGYVTTVSDPEGRPTVMEFVEKLGERVYPVGRLDFQSEGLLLMTNDGELANLLTRAASGVEKIYLVKVAGQPTEEDLEKLRAGVMIERANPAAGKHGGRVRTAPARVRQVRAGENPWFEVVLTEGRNRELRKMFSSVGHYVEKIRRVGYGPLVLDVEPGKIRELTPSEAEALRLTAEGKLKPRRVRVEAMLPKEAGRAVEARPGKPYGKRGPGRGAEKQFRPRFEKPGGEKEFRPRATDRGSGKEFRPRTPVQRPEKEFRPRFERPSGEKEIRPRTTDQGARKEFRPRTPVQRPEREFRPRFEKSSGEREFRPRTPDRGSGKEYRPRTPVQRPEKEFRPRFEKPGGEKEFRPRATDQGAKKEFRPRFEKRGGEKEFRPRGGEQFGSKERPQREFRGERREWQGQPRGDWPAWRKPGEARREFEPRRPYGGKPAERSFGKRPGPGQSPREGERPFRREGRPPEGRGPEGRGKSGFGSASKPGGKGPRGGFGGPRGGGGSGRFSGPAKPGGFRGGARPSRPGRRDGGKKRG